MRKITYLVLILFAATILQAQEQKPKLYNPEADARQEIKEAVKQAKEENKHVLIQVGGNW